MELVIALSTVGGIVAIIVALILSRRRARRERRSEQQGSRIDLFAGDRDKPQD